ncbi:MAG: SIMPL domain-containing protein, partial [Alphaproteobacteria bacterium]|nr:SIMPL domain-containing protein [Alphaproteobacteria bacterium]
TAQMRIENSQKAVADFLKAQGMADDEFSVQRTDVVDLLAREYHNENPNKIRFIVYGNVMIRTSNVDLMQKISGRMTDLIKAGIVFTTEGVGSPASLTPYYLFTKLNDVKLDMLAAATKNARAAALQFARDANVPLGGLVQASQGTFSILPGDRFPGATEESQITKTVRVVSTFDYALGNTGFSVDWLPGK